jgi:hypothetical protein
MDLVPMRKREALMILRLVWVLPEEEEEEGVPGEVIEDAIVVGCLLVSGECSDSVSRSKL